MRKVLTLLILLSLFVGMAGAVPGVTISKIPTFNWGPSQGMKNVGTIQAGDLYATDDLEVGDDADFGGDVDIAGTLTVAVLSPDATTASNELGHDLTVLDGTDITAAAGAEVFDYSASTAAFKTSQDTNTMYGNVVINAAKTFTTGTGLSTFLGNMYVSGTKTFTMGTGAAQFGGALNAANVKANTTLYSAGTLNSGGTATLNALKVNGTLYTVGTVTGNGQVTGATIKANTSIYSAGTLNAGGVATLNSAVVNTTVNAAADGIRANSIILPGEMIVTVPLTKTDFAAGELNRSIFIADDAWTITSIEEVHNVAESTATTLGLSVQKLTGTQALNGGINITNGNISLKGTANTVQTATLSLTSGRTTLADGNRIGILCNLTGTNAMSEFRGGLLTIHMKRV